MTKTSDSSQQYDLQQTVVVLAPWLGPAEAATVARQILTRSDRVSAWR